MSLFGILDTSGSGMYANRKFLDAISSNISNINDATSPDKPAFQEEFIQAQANNYGDVGGGVKVTAALFGDSTGRLVSDPNNPLSQNGLVKYPDINLSDQMTNMIIAQRGYEANIAMVTKAKDMYEQAIGIGK